MKDPGEVQITKAFRGGWLFVVSSAQMQIRVGEISSLFHTWGWNDASIKRGGGNRWMCPTETNLAVLNSAGSCRISTDLRDCAHSGAGYFYYTSMSTWGFKWNPEHFSVFSVVWGVCVGFTSPVSVSRKTIVSLDQWWLELKQEGAFCCKIYCLAPLCCLMKCHLLLCFEKVLPDCDISEPHKKTFGRTSSCQIWQYFSCSNYVGLCVRYWKNLGPASADKQKRWCCCEMVVSTETVLRALQIYRLFLAARSEKNAE